MTQTRTYNKRWRTLSLAAMLGLVLTLLLAACGDSTATTSPATTTAFAQTTAATTQVATTAAAATQAVSPNAVTITFWGDWGGEGEKQFNTMVDTFNKTHKDIQVKYVVTEDMITKFLTASTSGTAPDIMFWDRWRTSLYAPKNVLMPIDDFMSKDNISRDDFYQEALKELSNNGKLYGLPLTVDARALLYNKKLLDEAGVKPPTTWDQLSAAAAKLTKWNGDKLERSGFSLQDSGLFNMYLQQAGGQMLSADGTKTAFNGTAGLNVLNYWDKLMNKDKVYQVGFEEGLGKDTDAFVTGKVAMQYTGPWIISTYKKYGKELDFGIVPPLAGPNGDKGSVMGGFGLVIPKAAKHQKEAWEFEKW